MKFWALVFAICVVILITPRAKAQIVSIPIQGSPLSLSVQANPQPLQNINNNPAATAYNLGDDSWANVALPFSFPFYGKSFDISTMYSNGAVQFGNPVPVGGWPYWNNAFCCSGQQLNNNLSSGYNYSIMPLWTDLVGYTGGNHYTLGTSNTMTYGWYGVGQYGQPNNKSSFELKIDSTGGIDMRWSGALVSYSPVTIGTIGDASKGEYTQNYYNSGGINLTSPVQLSTGVDMCLINPLYSLSCPGYQEAYFSQQCLLNLLYSPFCPGYADAYKAYLAEQACKANSQSSPSCPGYVAPVIVTTTNTTTTSTTPQLVSDPVVNQTITTTSTSTAPTAPAAPIQLTSPSSSQQTTTALIVESVQTQSSSSSSSSTSSSTSTSSNSTATASTPKQTMQQSRVEAAKREAVAKGSEAVKESGEAKSMNAQVATQGLVIAAMGFNPSFDAYNNVVMRDVPFYKPYTVYGEQKNVDNARVGRRLFGATDQLHNQMVNSQYQLGN